jgi:hypothetical protein
LFLLLFLTSVLAEKFRANAGVARLKKFSGTGPELELKNLQNLFPKWEEYANLKP